MTNEDYILVQSFSHVAYRSCNIKEDAEDVMQDVCLKICLNDKFDLMPEYEKKRYIFTTIKHQLIDRYRSIHAKKRTGKKTEFADYHKSTKPDVFSILELKEVIKKSKGNIMCQALFLQTLGFSIKEITIITGCKQNAVLTRVRKGRMFLRESTQTH